MHRQELIKVTKEDIMTDIYLSSLFLSLKQNNATAHLGNVAPPCAPAHD